MRGSALAVAALLAVSCGPGDPTPPGPAAAGAPKTISVDLDNQRLFAWEGQELAHWFHVVTGTCAAVLGSGAVHID